MNAAQAAFLAGFTLLLVALVAACAGIVLASARSSGLARGRGLLRALELSPALPAAPARWAYYLHRITGIGIAGFLVLHIVDVSLLAFSTRLYNQVHLLYAAPALRAFECALVLAVLFHSLNGLRLIVTDLADLGMRASAVLLGAVVVLTVALGAPASVLIMAPAL